MVIDYKGFLYAPADKRPWITPQGHRLESHTKIPVNRRFPRFSVTSFPYRGTDGAARAMQARLDIAESRQKSTKSSLEEWMFSLVLSFAPKERTYLVLLFSKNKIISFEREKNKTNIRYDNDNKF